MNPDNSPQSSSLQNPWTTLSSRKVYENPWIKVVENQVLNPAGNAGIYGVVHFQNQAIGVAPYEDGHLWMVGQYRYPLERYSWEIPEGGGSPEETPLEAARRELLEETGLSAAHYEPLLELHTSNSVCDEWGIVYLARGLQQGEARPEETEDLKVRRMPLEEVFERVEKREITDSLTVAAIYKLMYLKAVGKLP
jgi:8-oxo-dGTP pyrophosphatase MutT (NUDIX family)